MSNNSRVRVVGPSSKAVGTYKMAAKLALRGVATGTYGSEIASDHRPYCDAPVRIGRRTDPRETGRTVEVSMWGPCRKCEKCLFFRRKKWATRMGRELDRCEGRTWFVTLTFSPIHLAGILARANANYTGHVSMDREFDNAAYKDLQVWIAKLRRQKGKKGSPEWRPGLRFRYFAVMERGAKYGRPHYHMLVHEVGFRPILPRWFWEEWPSRCDVRIVDGSSFRVSHYVAKYLTKSIDVRPRASLNYGHPKSC